MLFLVIGCTSLPARKFSSLSKMELDVYEVVLRYQFENNVSAQQEWAHAYYISFYRGDPSDEFIDRFSGQTPVVLKRSECKMNSEGVINRQTKEPGLIFYLGEIRWVSEAEVEVDGGYYENDRSASGNTYFLHKKDGKWKCYSHGTRWISNSEQAPGSNDVNAV